MHALAMANKRKSSSGRNDRSALAEGIDVVIGKRLRFYRLQKGVSQTEIGAHVGLTFQQIQKYEKGSNRLSTSRLLQFAAFLDISPDAFLAGLTPTTVTHPDPIDEMRDALQQPYVLELVREFTAIESKAVRKGFVDLVNAFNTSS